MKNIWFVIIGLVLVQMVSSCQKNDELTITLKQQGLLSVKFVDNQSKPLPNTKVSLYIGNSIIYDTKKTNEGGVASFGELLSGIYSITAEGIEINGKKYSVYKFIQITPGMNSEIVINPEEYVGDLTLDVRSSMNNSYEIVPQINIALIPLKYLTTTVSHATLLSAAYATGKTNAGGQVKITGIPAYTDYAVYAYFDGNHSNITSLLNSSTIHIMKDEEEVSSITVPKQDIYDITGNAKLYFHYYGYDANGSYGDHAVANLNVILVSQNDYYNLSSAGFDQIKAKALYTGITNSSGNIDFNGIKAYSNYVIFAYLNNTKYGWINTYYSLTTTENQTTTMDIDCYYYSWIR